MEEKRLEGLGMPAMPTTTHVPSPVLLQADPKPLEIDLQSTAVIVIDMQNCFVKKGGFFDLWGCDIVLTQRVIEPIKRITNAARTKGVKVVYIAHVYSPDLRDSGGPNSPNWYKDAALSGPREHPEWGDKFYNRGTWGAEIIDELKPQESDLFVEKPRYSAFFGTNLDIILRTYSIKYLVFVGIATNCCVESSIRDAFNLDYFSILISDAAMNYGPQFTQEATIFNVKDLYGWVTTTENIVKAME